LGLSFRLRREPAPKQRYPGGNRERVRFLLGLYI
jgi:hypothetical protein